MISQSALNKTAQYYESILSHGRYRVGSSYTQIPIDRVVVEDNVIRVYLLVDHSFVGSINQFQLFDKDGDIFAEKADTLTKTELQGVLARFTFTVTEV